jgi:hypothetical protein
MRVDLLQQPSASRSATTCLARVEAIHALIANRRVVVDLRVERQDRDHRQLVALADGVVVEVVRRGDLDTAGAKGEVNVGVGDDRDLALAKRQATILPIRCGSVRLPDGPSPRCRRAWFPGASWRRSACRCRRPADSGCATEAVFFLLHHLEVGNGGLQHRVPVDQALAAVDQAFVDRGGRRFR